MAYINQCLLDWFASLGLAISCSMVIMQNTHKPNSPGALRHILPFLRPYRWQMGLAFLLLCLAAGSFMLFPLAFRNLIDFGFGGQSPALRDNINQQAGFAQHFLALFGLALFWACAVGARYFTVSWLGERVTADIRNAVYRNVMTQSPQFFETLQTGEVLSRLTGDTTLIQTVVGSSISMGLRSLFQFIGGMLMLAYTSAYLFSINLGLMALLTVPLILLSRHIKKLSRETQDRLADSSALAGEILNAMPTVQAFTQEYREIDRFKRSTEAGFNSAVKRVRMRAGMTASMITAIAGAIVFVLWIGAGMVASGHMSGGDLAAFILYAAMVAGAVGTLAEVWGDILRAAGAAERLLELQQIQPFIAENPQAIAPVIGLAADIHFNQISFFYPSRPRQPAIQALELHISAGETVALVGPSGAGKTTLFQLLQRFYDIAPGHGSITINGHDIRDMRLHGLRRMIAIVPQEPVIFSASALENIRYGRPDASDEEVLAAAEAAQVEEFVKRLPEGYHTFLGERGTRLSGGQRQRIAIARAILKNAPILLLDEATSALDAASEQLVQAGLQQAMRHKTSLIIAHRLATVQKVDRIIVMEHGRITEVGSPDILKQGSGLYARLAGLQVL